MLAAIYDKEGLLQKTNFLNEMDFKSFLAKENNVSINDLCTFYIKENVLCIYADISGTSRQEFIKSVYLQSYNTIAQAYTKTHRLIGTLGFCAIRREKVNHKTKFSYDNISEIDIDSLKKFLNAKMQKEYSIDYYRDWFLLS